MYVVRNGGGFSFRAFLPDPRERQPQDDCIEAELDDVAELGVGGGRVGVDEEREADKVGFMDWNDFCCLDDDEDEVCERRPGR